MAFGFLLVYLAILLVRPQEWYEPLKGFQLINVAAIVTILTTFLTPFPRESPFATLTREKYGLMAWGLLAAVVLSEATKFNVRYALDAFTDFGKVIVLFFLTLLLVNRPQRTTKVMWLFIFSMMVLGVHAILQLQTGQGFGGIEPFGSREDDVLRVRGTGMFHDPNDFAMLMVVATPLVFTIMRTSPSMPVKLFAGCSLPLIVFVLYHTHSRGGLMGFCGMLLAYFWVTKKGLFVRAFLISSAIGATFAFASERAAGGFQDESTIGRLLAWGTGNAFLKQNPLFGIGYFRWLDYERTAAHSSFVNCYAELGLVGYFFWLGLIWLVGRGLFRVIRAKDKLTPTVHHLAVGLFAALVGYVVSAFFLTRTYNHVLFVLLGTGIALMRYVRDMPDIPKGLLELGAREFRQAAIVTVISIPALWLIIRAYWIVSGRA